MNPSQKWKLIIFVHLFWKDPTQALHGPSSAWDGPVRPKIDPCRPSIDPQDHVNSAFSWDADSEMPQRLIAQIKESPLERRGGEISPLSPPPPPWLRDWLEARILEVFKRMLRAYTQRPRITHIIGVTLTRAWLSPQPNAIDWGVGGVFRPPPHRLSPEPLSH